MLNEAILWIQVVKYCISVLLVTSSEYDYLEILTGLLQTLQSIWSDVDTGADHLFLMMLIREVYLKYDIGIVFLYIIYTMNQSFIHVKNCHFPLLIRHPRLWEHYKAYLLSQLCNGWWRSKVSLNVFQCL